MKIAHVSPEFFPAIGGVGQVVRELASRQVKQGHEVHVFAPDWDKNKRIKKKEEIIDGIKVHRCRYLAQMGNFSTFWPELFPRLLSEKLDIIHSHLFAHPHFIMSAIVAKIKGIPHIHTTHCPWSDAPRSLIGRFGIVISYNLFSRFAFKITNKIIAITPWENSFIKKYGAKNSQILNIPNGMAEIFLRKSGKNDFKKKHRIKGPIVLFFGRLNFTKAPNKFVEIAKIVLKQKPNITFVIRGPDEGLKDKVKKLIGNEKRILLLEETRDREEIAKMYQASDLYVLPSYREGLPLTIFEAMAAGLPIIATPVNGVPYEIKQPENGFLIKFGENDKFAKAIIRLIDDKKLRNKIALNNIKKSKRYNWDKITQEINNIYINEKK